MQAKGPCHVFTACLRNNLNLTDLLVYGLTPAAGHTICLLGQLLLILTSFLCSKATKGSFDQAPGQENVWFFGVARLPILLKAS